MSKDKLYKGCTFPACERGNTIQCVCKAPDPATAREIDIVFHDMGTPVCPVYHESMLPIQCNQSRIENDAELLRVYGYGVDGGRSEVGGIPGCHASCILQKILSAADGKRQKDILNTYCFGLAVGVSTASVRYKISKIEIEEKPTIVKIEGELLPNEDTDDELDDISAVFAPLEGGL